MPIDVSNANSGNTIISISPELSQSTSQESVTVMQSDLAAGDSLRIGGDAVRLHGVDVRIVSLSAMTGPVVGGMLNAPRLLSDYSALSLDTPFADSSDIAAMFPGGIVTGGSTTDQLARLKVVEQFGDRWLEQLIVGGQVGLGTGGTQFTVRSPIAPQDTWYFAYDIYTPPGSVWKRAGKLPGTKMFGGILTGGTNLNDGWKPGVHLRATFGDDWEVPIDRGYGSGANDYGIDTGSLGMYLKELGEYTEQPGLFSRGGVVDTNDPASNAVILTPGTIQRIQVKITLNTRETAPYVGDSLSNAEVIGWVQDITDELNPGPLHINIFSGLRFTHTNGALNYDGASCQVNPSSGSFQNNDNVTFSNGATGVVLESDLGDRSITLKDYDGSIASIGQTITNQSRSGSATLIEPVRLHSDSIENGKTGMNEIFHSFFYGGGSPEHTPDSDEFRYLRNYAASDQPIWWA